MSASATCPLCGYGSRHISVPHPDFSWLYSDATVGEGGNFYDDEWKGKMVWRCPCGKSVAIEADGGEWEWFIRKEEI